MSITLTEALESLDAIKTLKRALYKIRDGSPKELRRVKSAVTSELSEPLSKYIKSVLRGDTFSMNKLDDAYGKGERSAGAEREEEEISLYNILGIKKVK